jgi:hypothetical protein
VTEIFNRFFYSLHADTDIVLTLSDLRSGYDPEGLAEVKVFRKNGIEYMVNYACI